MTRDTERERERKGTEKSCYIKFSLRMYFSRTITLDDLEPYWLDGFNYWQHSTSVSIHMKRGSGKNQITNWETEDVKLYEPQWCRDADADTNCVFHAPFRVYCVFGPNFLELLANTQKLYLVRMFCLRIDMQWHPKWKRREIWMLAFRKSSAF